MSARWRVALAAIFAATIAGGLLPHGVLADAQSATTEMMQVVGTPLVAAPNCFDATCGKGSPASPAPAPMVALAGVLSGLAIAAIAAARVRRHRSAVVPLPAGAPDPLLRPPQFS